CIALWARTLTALPGSRMQILTGAGTQADQRLRDAFSQQGIGPERIEFLGRRSRVEYWQLYQAVDIVLDTFPYTGCNTTCDAIVMGVPVITLAGRSCMARQSASVLAHLGLYDLIAATPEGYVKM